MNKHTFVNMVWLSCSVNVNMLLNGFKRHCNFILQSVNSRVRASKTPTRVWCLNHHCQPYGHQNSIIVQNIKEIVDFQELLEGEYKASHEFGFAVLHAEYSSL